MYCGQGVRRLITVLDGGGEHGSGPGLSVSINKIYVFPMVRRSNKFRWVLRKFTIHMLIYCFLMKEICGDLILKIKE